jgi:hypothetical protein
MGESMPLQEIIVHLKGGMRGIGFSKAGALDNAFPTQLGDQRSKDPAQG